jgi:predicted PurR-regulated permease PerM
LNKFFSGLVTKNMHTNHSRVNEWKKLEVDILETIKDSSSRWVKWVESSLVDYIRVFVATRYYLFDVEHVWSLLTKIDGEGMC